MFDAYSAATATGMTRYLVVSLFFYCIFFFFFKESPIHRALFWVAISVLQLDEVALYAAGLALLEQNLHTLNSQGTFDKTVCGGRDQKEQMGKLMNYKSVFSEFGRGYDDYTRTIGVAF